MSDMAAARKRADTPDASPDNGDGPRFQKGRPTRLDPNRPPPDTTPGPLRPPPEPGSIKKALRQVRQQRGLTQQQLADMTQQRPAEWGHRYSQADIQKFETPGRNGRPITMEVACAFDDTFGFVRGTLQAMAGLIDDAAMWSNPPADDSPAMWVAAVDRLIKADPYLSPEAAENLVRLYEFTHTQARASMPAGEPKRRRSTRRAENT